VNLSLTKRTTFGVWGLYEPLCTTNLSTGVCWGCQLDTQWHYVEV